MQKNLWVAGQSGNNQGRPKGKRHSVFTITGRIQAWQAKRITTKEFDRLYNEQTSTKDQWEIVKWSIEWASRQMDLGRLTDEQADRLHSQIMEAMNVKQKTG